MTDEYNQNFQLNKETIANFAGFGMLPVVKGGFMLEDGELDEEEIEDAYPCKLCNKKTHWKELYRNLDICDKCCLRKDI